MVRVQWLFGSSFVMLVWSDCNKRLFFGWLGMAAYADGLFFCVAASLVIPA